VSANPTPDQINEVAAFLFGRPTRESTLTLEEVYASLTDLKTENLDDLLRRFEHKGLIRIGLKDPIITLTPTGKEALVMECIPELVLGNRFIMEKYQDSVVHLIVLKSNGTETGGTGFFVSPYRLLITAAHVVRDRKIVRVENRHLQVVCGQPEVLWISEEPLDLAVLRCPSAPLTMPFRYNRQIEATELDKVLIFGYPPYAGHQVSLHFAPGEILSTPRQFIGDKKSLIISNAVAPGCSGGPVVNQHGLVVGVVSQENKCETEEQTTTYLSAAPLEYLPEMKF